MEAIVFDNSIVRESALYCSCADTLFNVSNRDYPNRYSFDVRIECLDMDSYEKNVCKGNPDNTVDAVIGVCNCTNDKRKTLKRLMLIEFRMDYQNLHNLSVTQMNKKVLHTRRLLGGDIYIDTNNYFIFDNCIGEQAKRLFANKANEVGSFKNCIAWSVNDFCTNVCSYDDLPYIPKFKKTEIVKDMCSIIDNGELVKLLRSFQYWLDNAKNLQYTNYREYDNISEALCEVWKYLKTKNFDLNEDEELELLILKDDLQMILSERFYE